MDVFSYLMHGFQVAMLPENLLIALIGAFIGTIVGMLPGLGPINGVAILLPFAFAMGLPPESALILLAAVYLGCEYGGRISAILINVPGDAAAIMSTLDGYPLAKQGKAGIALSISAWSSFVGSMIATVGVVLFEMIGFPASTALMAIVVGRLFGGSYTKCIIAGVIMGVASYVLFDRFLDVPLPMGF